MGCGGRPELAGECELAVVVQVELVPEEDHLVLQQRIVDRRDGAYIEVVCQPHAVNAGADPGAQFHHVEEFSHASISAGVGGKVNGLTDCDRKSGPCDGRHSAAPGDRCHTTSSLPAGSPVRSGYCTRV